MLLLQALHECTPWSNGFFARFCAIKCYSSSAYQCRHYRNSFCTGFARFAHASPAHLIGSPNLLVSPRTPNPKKGLSRLREFPSLRNALKPFSSARSGNSNLSVIKVFFEGQKRVRSRFPGRRPVVPKKIIFIVEGPGPRRRQEVSCLTAAHVLPPALQTRGLRALSQHLLAVAVVAQRLQNLQRPAFYFLPQKGA